MLDTSGRYLHTIKYLKARQIACRAFFFLRRRLRNIYGHAYPLFIEKRSERLGLLPSIPRNRSYGENGFSFLNQTLHFDGSVDWNYAGFGTLWAYNLNYFDFLNQSGMDARTGLRLIENFIGQIETNKFGIEPYPISLRIINWIKFLSRNGVRDRKIDGSLYAQARILSDNLEYHLLGNHLLENGFALLFAAFYFQDQKLYRMADRILSAELNEQILADGGHFELSPMYHQIILDRLLDCINLIENNPEVCRILTDRASPEKHSRIRRTNSHFSILHSRIPLLGNLLQSLQDKASSMLGWLNQVTFSNGDIPLVNDAAFGIAPETSLLREYAQRLDVREKAVCLGESGYRKIIGGNYEALIDVGPIGPDYIPGHAHADTLNFVLYVAGHPVIVDTGTSTYEDNGVRHRQRSTRAHNTVEIDGCDQSEMWGSFRVARRARVTALRETQNRIEAAHDGYSRLSGKPVHFREWRFHGRGLEIRDRINGNFREAVSRFHFHPDVRVEPLSDGGISGKIQICEGATLSLRILKGRGRLAETMYHPQFNVSLSNCCLEIPFTEKETQVEFTW